VINRRSVLELLGFFLAAKTDNFTRACVIAFGARHGGRAAATESILDELCDVAPAWIAELTEIGLEPKTAADLARVMRKRRADLA
jgi:hypothetical protein